MSDFECANRHLMAPSDAECPECGGPAVFMDGQRERLPWMEEESE